MRPRPCFTHSRNSRSFDRFVVASLLGTKFQTPVAKKTLNPTYPPKDATFDFPIYLSLADKLGVVELVVWDKDMIKKDYLGEAWIPIEDWFRDGNSFSFNDPENKVSLSSELLARTWVSYAERALTCAGRERAGE